MIDLTLTWLNTYGGIYLISKESKYTVEFSSINNETQCVRLFCWSSRFMIKDSCFIIGKLPLEKTSLNLGL